MGAWRAGLEVQGQIINSASVLLRCWTVGDTGDGRCRLWVLHRAVVLFAVSQVCASDVLCGDGAAVLGRAGVEGVDGPRPRLGDR